MEFKIENAYCVIEILDVCIVPDEPADSNHREVLLINAEKNDQQTTISLTKSDIKDLIIALKYKLNNMK